MRKTFLFLCLFFGSVGVSQAQDYSTGSALTGDTKLSCEAILCLASPTKPGECMASIRKYFSISARKWKDVVSKRKSFLNLCPVSNASNDLLLESIGIDSEEQKREINGYKNILLELPHDCSADSLNKTVVSRKETFQIYSKFVDRYLDKQNLSDSQKARERRRMLNRWDNSWDWDKKGEATVYRVNPTIPKPCITFYNHQWTPSKPNHNGNLDWYYSSEFKNNRPPSVWK